VDGLHPSAVYPIGSRTSLPPAIVPFDSLPVSTAASLTWQEAQAPYRVE